ncbi:DUF938 domain-containing protein [Methylobacterium sp. J-076]|uniref:DUF938 domain-containing protein n=1 Tax=Methylobacterium sp. J-076 TaxID=2836655 RepID=UPI001FB87F36|nr:DUF938 domain-containing protein [Methylobacterium sp. J-076]MCJ2015402.1 class I SAM-dependent methyltransferase [Methylobacterium sp. J-076]
MLSWSTEGDALTAPAVARNREAILAVLRRVLPSGGTVLEVAAGSGEHAVYFARALPESTWQPSDPEPVALRSIAAHARAAGLPNLRDPIALDAAAAEWPVVQAAAIVCINMVHIAPWSAAEGLFAGAGRLLPAGAPLVLYGPFREEGVPTAPSNEAFDADLRARDPRWGLRTVEAVGRLAASRGLTFGERVAMPANNLILVYRKAGA